MFDIKKIRSDFPFLNMKINEGNAVYLDNAASSQKPKTVIDRLTKVYEQEYANVHRGIHHLSMKATENFEDARNEIARFINSKSSEEIIFTKNATEAINLVASSYGSVNIQNGDEIIIPDITTSSLEVSPTTTTTYVARCSTPTYIRIYSYGNQRERDVD